ncbi:MAG: HAD-IIB family hydrolase [Myxococcales bacterium]|nr:HAD-IIB family hydrolase [Myxococcales bacterium]
MDDARPEPLASLAAASTALRPRLRVLATDVDGTLTTAGVLAPEALEALAQARAAGLRTVAVTGRSAGFADALLRLLPLDAAIAENGALALRRGPGGLERWWAEADADRRAEDARRLEALRDAMLRAFPDARLASDQPWRLRDLAFDVGEERAPLAASRIAEMRAFAEAAGARTTVSSVHLHAWFGGHDKATALAEVCALWLGVGRADQAHAVFVTGDSLNDEPLFAAFALSAAVAATARVLDQFTHRPRWIAERDGGEGFADVVRALLGPDEAR